MFELEALSARKGDALLLRWGKADDVNIAMIDGGPSGVWEETIHPRLTQLAGADPAGNPRPVELALVVVTHVDDDHVHGVIDLAEAIRRAQQQVKPVPAVIEEVWHNAFSDTLRASEFSEEPALVAALSEVSSAPGSLTAARGGLGASAGEPAADVASIRQGSQLEQVLGAINVPRNTSFGDRQGLVRSGQVVDVKGLRVSVLAPSSESLTNLKNLWKQKSSPSETAVAALAAAFDDPSVPNLSSIVLLVEFGGREMLLTGDARGDHILDAVKQCSGENRHVEVDLFKIPHHGSAHTNGPELFEFIRADHYVISANGEHGNPHPEVLQALLDTQKGRPISLYLTNHPMSGARKPEDVDRAREAERILDEARTDPNVTVVIRDANEPGVTVVVDAAT